MEGNGVSAKISEKQKPLWDKISKVEDELHEVALKQAKMEANIETLVVSVAEMRDLMSQQYVTRNEIDILRQNSDAKYVSNNRLLVICGMTFFIAASGIVAFILDKIVG